MAEVLENFDGRHRNLIDIFETRASEMEPVFEPHDAWSQAQKRLIGAYFLNEYSFEASALFNPSIVRHPDQAGAPKDGCRFILSLRAVGEGCGSGRRSGSSAGVLVVCAGCLLVRLGRVVWAWSAALASKNIALRVIKR